MAVGELLPLACTLLGAHSALMRALDEQLEWRAFRTEGFAERWEAAVPDELPSEEAARRTPERSVELDGALVYCRVLDCAGEVIGLAGFAFTPEVAHTAGPSLVADVRAVCETLDNYLEGIAAAARKHRVAVSASQALRTPILEDGADQAIRVLSSELSLARVLLLFGEPKIAGGLKYRFYQDGQPVWDSIDNPSAEVEAVLGQAEHLLDTDEVSLRALLGTPRFVETRLINGLNRAPIGKLVVAGPQGELDPEGSDVLHIFAECLSQRLVDYNRERRSLSAAFSPRTVNRLLRERDKYRRFLSPRVSEVAILFTDLCSFTALSERVLGDAQAIGELIDRWSKGCVEILFQHGGVFDKLVGDCAIGLFGPPFFESGVTDYALGAVRAAVDIARFTARLGEELGLSERLREAGIAPGLGAAAGVTAGSTSVGFFGPNDDYTGFSSSMNNAARLQGLAGFQEVLVAAPAAEAIEERLGRLGLALGAPRSARVKNVAEPLAYRTVVWPEGSAASAEKERT